MIRIHCLRQLTLALAGLAILTAAEPVRAQTKQQPFWGDANIAFSGTQFVVTAGKFKHMVGGYKVTGFGTNVPNTPAEGTDSGVLTLVASNGVLYFSYVVQPYDPVHYPGLWKGSYTILGGEGRFANASGVGLIRFHNPVGEIHLEGGLTY